MTKDDWIKQALPFLEDELKNILKYIEIEYRRSYNNSEEHPIIADHLIEDHKILTELRRVAIEEFNITEGEK